MRIAICDDEKRIQDYMLRIVRACCPDSEICCYSSGKELLVEGKTIDILFLDIQMPESSGMEIARSLRKLGNKTILIFITALEEYVFQAFDVGAFHYLVKPVTEEKVREVLEAAVAHYMEAFKNRVEERVLMIQHQGVYARIRLSDLIYAEVYNRKVILHVRKMRTDCHSGSYVEQERYQMEEVIYYGRLTELEAEVGEDFFRSHRSYLINFKYVERYHASLIELEYGGQALMAKKNYPEFVKKFLQYNKRERKVSKFF